MKSTILNIASIAFISLAVISCKDNTNKDEAMIEEAAPVTEMAVNYQVDTATSKIMWEGAKPTGKHNGTINISEGSLSVKDQAVEAGQFTIDMNSITVLDLEGDKKANLEAHLMGTVEGKEGDFFDVKQYPTAAFELTSIETLEGKSTVKGNLTIKDKTNPISCTATVIVDGDKLSVESETFEIDRTKWDVNYGSKSIFDSLGDKFINDDIKITLSIVATKA